MRVERAEKQQLDHGRQLAIDAFAGFIDHMPEKKRRQYWEQIYVPYEPFYAYQEILATIADRPKTRDSVLTSFEQLVEFVTDEGVHEYSPSNEEQRLDLRDRYLRGREPDNAGAILARHPALQQFSELLFVRQTAWQESERNDKYLLSRKDIEQLRAHNDHVISMLGHREFRQFFDVSRAKILGSEIRKMIRYHTGGIVFASAVLLATLFITTTGYSGSTFVGPILASAAPGFAAMLGAATSSMRRLIQDIRAGVEALQSPGGLLTTLFLAFMSGLVLTQSGFNVRYEDFTSKARYANIAMAFIVGYALRDFIDNLQLRSRNSDAGSKRSN